MRRCVWSRNIKNEEAMTRVGSQRHKKKIQYSNKLYRFVAQEQKAIPYSLGV